MRKNQRGEVNNCVDSRYTVLTVSGAQNDYLPSHLNMVALKAHWLDFFLPFYFTMVTSKQWKSALFN